MNEERGEQEIPGLSEEGESAHSNATIKDDVVLSEAGSAAGNQTADGDFIDTAASMDEEDDELKPRLPLIAGPIKGKGRRLVRKEDHPRVVLTGAQRLMCTTARCSTCTSFRQIHLCAPTRVTIPCCAK